MQAPAVCGQVHADNPRVDVPQPGVGDAEFFLGVAAQVVVNGVGRAREPAQDGLPFLFLQIHDQRALAKVEGLKEQRVAGGHRLAVAAHVAPGVAALVQIFDLDDVGAELRELQ